MCNQAAQGYKIRQSGLRKKFAPREDLWTHISTNSMCIRHGPMRSTGRRWKRILRRLPTERSASACCIFIWCSMGFCGWWVRERRRSRSRSWKTSPARGNSKRTRSTITRRWTNYCKASSPARLKEMIEVPWFQPPLKISVRHALTQAAMHSHYHRGQNATRLRELGGVPPGTDFIVWLRDGKPAAKWS